MYLILTNICTNKGVVTSRSRPTYESTFSLISEKYTYEFIPIFRNAKKTKRNRTDDLSWLYKSKVLLFKSLRHNMVILYLTRKCLFSKAFVLYQCSSVVEAIGLVIFLPKNIICRQLLDIHFNLPFIIEPFGTY